MSFLIDTNVLSQMRRPALAGAGFRAWMDRSDKSQFFISVITLLEVEFGAAKARQKSLPNAAVLREWIDLQLLPEFRGRTLPIDTSIVQRCAPLQLGSERLYADSLIAATALVHDLVVVTRNIRDYQAMGVRLLNPFDLTSP